MVKIDRIRINYQDNPVGIDRINDISWRILSEQRDVFQKSYRLQIAENADFTDLLYDSGRVETNQSVHVTAGDINNKLHSSAAYYMRVQAETTAGMTDWADACFVTALLSAEEWTSPFITIEKDEDKDKSRGSYLRKEIRLKKPVKTAYAYTTALGLYHFYINGERIGADEFTPGWTSYNKHLLYQIYDVADALSEGVNTLGAELGAGWYKGDMGFRRVRNHYGRKTAFSCLLKVVYEDGECETFGTDAQWKGSFGPILFSEIYDGETYDARLEIDGWNENGCDESGWQAVSEVPFDISVLTPQSGCKVREISRIPAKRIFRTPQGDTVIDFGQNMTGWIEFRVKGQPGDKAELNCFEVLDADGNVYLDNLRTAKATVTYICGDGEEHIFHENFSFQGFQYAKIASWPGEPKTEDFTACVLHSDMEPAGNFECSDPDVNQLHHNILWGMKGNFLDVPTDCPQRDERLGWTGDAQIFCRTAAYLMDTYTFYRKWLADMAADQLENGGVPHVIPDVLIGKAGDDKIMKDGDHSAAAWADADVIIPWTMYLMYGDTEVIRKQYDSMKKWIGFMREHSEGNIWNYQLQFGDWVALDAEEGSYFGATPNDLTCTAYYAYSTQLFSKMAAIIGETEDAEEYGKLYEEIKKTYQETFFENGHLKAQTQTAQIVSLYFNLVPEEYRGNVTGDLLRLLEEQNGHLVTGFVGTPYFCHALSQNGHTKEAYELLLKDDFPSWLYQVKQGATTVWEHWDGKKPDGTMWSPDMNSFNHYAYGAVAEWIYRMAAGIEVKEDGAGFKRFILEPHPGGGFTYMKAEHDCLYGKIRSEWEMQGSRLSMTVEIPCNTTAVIRPWGISAVTEADGLKFEETAEGLQAEAGSGIYRIECRMA